MTLWALPEASDGSVNMDGHEGGLLPILEGLLPEGGVLVDIGAHMGLWTIRLGRRASKVIAVEPNRPTADILRENITLNGLGGIAEVLEAAAWDSDEPLTLENPTGRADTMSGLMRLVPDERGQIRGTRLDDALPPLDRIDLVKVDTEGADIRALTGMARHIARHKPVLFVECHHVLPYCDYTLDELESFIEGIGYQYTMERWATQEHLLCRPRGDAS